MLPSRPTGAAQERRRRCVARSRRAGMRMAAVGPVAWIYQKIYRAGTYRAPQYGVTVRGHTNRSSKSGAGMRPKIGHHNAHRWNHRLWAACRTDPLKRFVSEAQAGKHVTESHCTHECAAVVIVGGKAPHPALDS